MNILTCPGVPDEVLDACNLVHSYFEQHKIDCFMGLAHRRAYENALDAMIASDQMRTTYQLQLEALQDAVEGFRAAKRSHRTQKAAEALLALSAAQIKANQP